MHRHALLADRTGRRFSASRQRQHGQGDPIDLHRQGLRPARLRAGRLRRRRGPARLCGRPRTGHAAGARFIPTPASSAPTASALADVVRHRAAGVYRPYSAEAVAELDTVFASLGRRRAREVLAEGIPHERIDSPPIARPALSGTRRLSDHSRTDARQLRRGLRSRARNSSTATGTRTARWRSSPLAVEVSRRHQRLRSAARSRRASAQAGTRAADDQLFRRRGLRDTGRFRARAACSRAIAFTARPSFAKTFHDDRRPGLASRSAGRRRTAADRCRPRIKDARSRPRPTR